MNCLCRHVCNADQQHPSAAPEPVRHGGARRPGIAASVLLAATLATPALAAETITYPGDALQNIAGISPNSLGPTNDGSGFSASVSGNVINMMAGGAIDPWNVIGATEQFADLINNTVNISGGSVGTSVWGAFSGSSGHVVGNTVNFSGGVLPGGGKLVGGYSNADPATGNMVNISGGTIGNAEIFGGHTGLGGSATGNMVNISGGTIGSFLIAGGYNAVTGSGNTTGNTVRISGSPVFNQANTELYGGFGFGAGDYRTGNTLELHTTGVTVKKIGNFEKLHFYLPASSITNGAVVLTLTDVAGADIRGSTVGVGMEGGGTPLALGNKVTLIQTAGSLTTDATNITNLTTGMQGISLQYEFELSATANTLGATVTKMGVNPQTKSLLEGRVSALALTNQGADLAAGDGLAQAVSEAQRGNESFGALSGGSSRYKSGSHVDLKGANLILGMSTQLPSSAGRLTLGGFFEAGWANYDSYNSFSTMPSVHADGNTRSYGLGVLAQQDFANNFYVQGSARAGHLKTSYRSATLQNMLGQSASYDSSRTYVGLHLGAGYVLPMGSKGDALDLYGKLFWSRYGSQQQVILGDTFDFAALESLRTRLGGRYSHKLNENSSLYGGLAWEYEHKGAARGTVFGLSMLEPSLGGSTGLLEAGVKFNPSNNKHLRLEAGLQGYVGKRQGAALSAKVLYAF